jgi:DNA polymerase-3 subunit delta
MPLTPQDLAADLKKGKIAPVYVIVGEAPWRTAEAARFIVESVEKARGGADRHMFSLGGKDKEVLSEILTACNTFSMFGTTQVVLVEDVPLPTLPKEVAAYCKAPSASTVLVLRGAPPKPGAKSLRRKEVEGLEVHGAVLWLEEEKAPDVARGLVTRARRLGLALAPDAAELLVERLGGDVGLIQGELERISLTLHPDTQATREKVDALVTDAREFDPFELLEPVTQRDRRAAMRMVDGLLSAGEEPVKLVAMLANGLRDLWTARCCRDVAELKQRVGFRPDFVLRRMQEQSSRFSEAEYERLWELLYDTDRRLKSARLPTSEKGELVVQLVIEATLPPL